MSNVPAWFDSSRPVPDLRTPIPGSESTKIIERDASVTSPSLPRAYPFAPWRGFGAVLEDMDGNLFLDFNAGIAVNSTGHSHPKVVDAIVEQAGQLQHYSASDFFLPIYSQMCKALAATAPMSDPVRVFLTNSGAEAVEGSVKLARYATHRPYVISFFGAFHGRTYGALTLTASKAKYHTGFGPLLPGVLHAPYAYTALENADPQASIDRTIGYLENTLFTQQVDPREVAAIIVEPIQGEGGYIIPPPGWLTALKELCERYGILLIADEVQSGMGRTGRMWAIELDGVEPDILVTAKGLASGLPLGAFMARAELMERWTLGSHGSTYGGSPIPCAAGLATLEVIQSEGLMANAANQGDYLLAGLRAMAQRHPSMLLDVRGVGLMIGVEFPTGEIAERVQYEAFQRGLLVLEAGQRVIRMSPPLVINQEQAETGLRLFEEAVAQVAGDASVAGDGVAGV